MVEREATLIAAAQDVAAKTSAVAKAEADITVSSVKARLLDEALKKQKKAQKVGDATVTEVQKEKAKVDSIKESVAAMKGTKSHPKVVSALQKQLNKLGLDDSVVSSVNTAFTKDPSARGEFDAIVLVNLDKDLQGEADKIDARLNAEEPGRARRAHAAEVAQIAYDTAAAEVAAAGAGRSGALVAVKAAEVAMEAADASAKGFNKEMKDGVTSLAKLRKDAAHFEQGPHAAFRRLEWHAAPPPKPQEPAEGAAP